MRTVTQDYTAVSTTFGGDIPGAVLNLRRTRLAGRPVFTRMSDDGRLFPDTDSAMRFARDRGYLQDYFTSPELRARRIARAGTA